MQYPTRAKSTLTKIQGSNPAHAVDDPSPRQAKAEALRQMHTRLEQAEQNLLSLARPTRFPTRRPLPVPTGTIRLPAASGP
jgi:hypothetical protein